MYACEYLALAPRRLSYEDLEVLSFLTIPVFQFVDDLSSDQTAQRDVLSAFDYSLGVTPQPVMDELWFSLESLRSLLDFENGWQTAMADAWCGLFDAICGMTIPFFHVD